jgi:hypothetical protein
MERRLLSAELGRGWHFVSSDRGLLRRLGYIVRRSTSGARCLLSPELGRGCQSIYPDRGLLPRLGRSASGKRSPPGAGRRLHRWCHTSSTAASSAPQDRAKHTIRKLDALPEPADGLRPTSESCFRAAASNQPSSHRLTSSYNTNSTSASSPVTKGAFVSYPLNFKLIT